MSPELPSSFEERAPLVRPRSAATHHKQELVKDSNHPGNRDIPSAVGAPVGARRARERPRSARMSAFGRVRFLGAQSPGRRSQPHRRDEKSGPTTPSVTLRGVPRSAARLTKPNVAAHAMTVHATSYLRARNSCAGNGPSGGPIVSDPLPPSRTRPARAPMTCIELRDQGMGTEALLLASSYSSTWCLESSLISSE